MMKDSDALQTMIDNVKKAFSLKEDRSGKKLDKDQGSVRMLSFTRPKNSNVLVRRSLKKISLKITRKK